MATDGAQIVNNCRVSINAFLQDLINNWSFDCQHKSDAELVESLKSIKQLCSDFNEAIGAYIQAVEAGSSLLPNTYLPPQKNSRLFLALAILQPATSHSVPV